MAQTRLIGWMLVFGGFAAFAAWLIADLAQIPMSSIAVFGIGAMVAGIIAVYWDGGTKGGE